MAADGVAAAVEALRRGEPVLLPTDGVYGLCASVDEDAVGALYRLKGRGLATPTAVIGATAEHLLELLPELGAADRARIRSLLPGPYTLVVRNPARRFPWLTGERPETLGVRVAVLPAAAQRVLDAVGAVAATSANEPGSPAAAALEQVPDRIRAGCGAELDGGALPGTASTVIELTGDEPVVLREGAGDVRVALERLRAARPG